MCVVWVGVCVRLRVEWETNPLLCTHHHPHHDLWRNLQVGHGTFVFCLLRDRDSREEILKKSSLASTHIRTRNTKEELVL